MTAFIPLDANKTAEWKSGLSTTNQPNLLLCKVWRTKCHWRNKKSWSAKLRWCTTAILSVYPSFPVKKHFFVDRKESCWSCRRQYSAKLRNCNHLHYYKPPKEKEHFFSFLILPSHKLIITPGEKIVKRNVFFFAFNFLKVKCFFYWS